jgi:hypothetical protein
VATQVLNSVADIFPVGTTVGAYARRTHAEFSGPSAAPSTAAITTAVVASNGSLTFNNAGIVQGGEYVAYALVSGQHRYLRFTVTSSKDVSITGVLAHTGSTVGFYGATPVARAGAIAAPATQTAAYVQADAQSLKTAIDAIRVALQNVGITS